ncbi:hypothetical protein D3C73_1325920 [compost metagenome]
MAGISLFTAVMNAGAIPKFSFTALAKESVDSKLSKPKDTDALASACHLANAWR